LSPKVSVIIPTYNRSELVERAVKSVLCQTYTDYEIIVVDDGSTDDTRFNLQSYPVRYIRQNNSGSASARNRGIRESKGKYIAFLDSDDWFLPDKLARQVEVMEGNPDCVLSHTSYYRCGQHWKVINSGAFTGNVWPQILINCPIAVPTVMVRRDCLEGNGFKEIKSAYDLILWADLTVDKPIIGINEPLTCISVDGDTWAYNNQLQKISIDLIIEYIKRGNLSLKRVERLGLLGYWNLIKASNVSENKYWGYFMTKYAEGLKRIMRAYHE
jgi:glycosyltransferase involved in cell wall biosynthesis